MDTLAVSRHSLLHFMNEGDPEASGHHSAITGFLGEPLAGAFIEHYLSRQGKPARIVNWKVTPGTKSGQRLDAWVYDGLGTLYQTEVKMWAGNAIGGLRLPSGIHATERRRRGQQQWHKRLWNKAEQTLQADNVRKVLKPMRRPAGYDHAQVEPLLCLWWQVNLQDTSEPWFTVPIAKDADRGEVFDHLNVFSLTAYLMSLEDDVLHLNMPLVSKRLEWLFKILNLNERIGQAFESHTE